MDNLEVPPIADDGWWSIDRTAWRNEEPEAVEPATRATDAREAQRFARLVEAVGLVIEALAAQFSRAVARAVESGTDDAWERVIDTLDARDYAITDAEMDVLVHHLHSPHPSTAAAGLARVLGFVSRAPESLHGRAIVTLGELLSHESARVRQAAVEGLWEFDNRAATGLLELARRDPDEWVRRAAQVALQGR